MYENKLILKDKITPIGWSETDWAGSEIYKEIRRDLSQAEIEQQKIEQERQEAERQKTKQIIELKQQLAATDYLAIKHSEGLIDNIEYAPIKAERQKLREKINMLITINGTSN